MAKKGSGADVPAEGTDQDLTPQPDDVPEPQPEPEPGATDTPQPSQGKSPEELAQELELLQKKLGEQGKELGDVKSNFEYQQRLHELERQKWEQAQSQPTQSEQEKSVDWNYENPVPSVQEVVRRELQKEREAQQKAQAEYTQARANSLYAEGRRTSMMQNPKMYEGIERDVENAVSESYRRGIIGVDDLRNTETWNMAAKLIHLKNEDYSRLQPSEVKPVGSTETELPTPAKPGTTEKPFTGLNYNERAVQDMMAQYGWTKEEAEEIVKEEQERVMRGEK
jgi:hypothetical protein